VNGDLHERAVVATDDLAWTARDGIEEKLLEQTPEGSRRTALVRLPPGGLLATSGGGAIDLLVLEGTLREKRFVYSTGSYLREAVGCSLYSERGCVVFVKQRPAHRVERRSMDIAAVVFERAQTPGLWRGPLHSDDDGDVVLLRFDAGITIAPHVHEDGEELFVLRGEITDELGTYSARWWLRQPDASVHSVQTAAGCLTLTFAHHLR
jgi:anti-sigma factor ChrR (cupin superfamily)